MTDLAKRLNLYIKDISLRCQNYPEVFYKLMYNLGANKGISFQKKLEKIKLRSLLQS